MARTSIWRRTTFLAAAVIGLLGSAASLQAATIMYGNFGPVGTTSFLNVSESSGTDAVPLYGPPSPFAVGLDFNPMNFVATSSGGGADITDGQLNFTVKDLSGIPSVQLFERGDYTLAGTGAAATQDLAGAIIQAKVTEINGVPVAPIALPAANASVGFNLIANPGVVQPWSLGVSVVVPAALGNVTRLDVVINNSLSAISEPQSIAFIAKKDFDITIPKSPEPASLTALAAAAMGLLARRRK